MSQTVSASRALLRVSVQSEGRRLDIGIPGQLPLVELMPGFARSLGVLDATMTHAGYTLERADGTALDASRGAIEQGVREGDLLTLARGGLLAQPRVYDDIVEAVLDATAEQHRPWTPQDNARTALAASLTLLGICAVLLLAAGPSLGVGAFVAGGGAIVLLAVAAAVGRLGQSEAGQGLALAAAVFGGVAGYLAVPAGPAVWGWPLAAAGLGAAVVGAVALALTPQRPEYQLIPIAAGAAVAVMALFAALFPGAAVASYALGIAIVVTVGNGLPWLAMSSTRIRVISPQSDADVFAAPTPIDAGDVRARAAAGHRILLSVRIATGLTALAATPLVAGANAAGAALCALAFVGMMFPSRQSFARSNVLALLSLGTLGLAATGVTVSLAQPGLRVPLLIVLIAVTAIVVTVTLLAPKARARLGRLADTAEVVIIALLLPLGVIAAGWA
ncbi:MAG: type VII secretion integral membrane protein EccD [Microbacterium sp.]|uniref:type VII secretion integral membrane protein EccD n=1 Tax=Microbacterium sp. TaxID=51671 RepID=UPI001AC21BDE|nr:type VII secretion integral membrane protein EccD [Microbacterium sp.]MBN9177607.1 type VII secretion integral membrane protein EccD [Microbacterium sp.]